MIRPYIKLRVFGLVLLTPLANPLSVAAQRVPRPIPVVAFSSQHGAVRSPSTSGVSVGLVAGALILASILPDAVGDRLPYADCAPCDSSRIWGIDKVAIGPYNGDWGNLSWVSMIATVGGSMLMVNQAFNGQGDVEQQAYVTLTYTVLTAAALTGWGKVLAARPRPILYTDEAGLYATRDNGRSMPSGHTSMAFAFAVAAAKLVSDRGTQRNAEIGLLLSGAAATGVMRVLAHRHFPTDVTAGAALGTLVGILVPNLVK